MKVHLIAVGGSAMHNLAIALHKKGIQVTGSDDEIVDPAKSNLQRNGLLPASDGWDINRITKDLDAVILGMHARLDNPELVKAQELGIRIYSYPEYLYEQTKNKTRVVIAGSHGKTTITAMILHVLKYHNKNFDYLAGAALDGFETSLKLSEDASVAIFEGDEYLASALDRRPKFLLYKPDIALISGVAWDHINVFPTYRSYVEQFENFVKEMPNNGSLVYCNEDEEVRKLTSLARGGVNLLPYNTLTNVVKDGVTYLHGDAGDTRLEVFGKHNLLNMGGAWEVCLLLGITEKEFAEAISSFKGAARRLQLVARNEVCNIYWDFAHSPSKLTATIQAVKEQFPHRKLVACMELHTFSSLTKEFLKEYKNTMDKADVRKVYFNPHVLEHKRLAALSAYEVKNYFGNVEVYTDSAKMIESLKQLDWKDTNLLMMSSGNFDGVNVKSFAEQLLHH
ncbi:MAG TPA: Mur ligase family protein [Bacteroidia bacterium]|jgi:UDP-N-acetylmuramate: L-alanyl-gamma-D-glutamyl-meso-diaminopimelate ligase|nr:Mur ligase family protein [Bacteroidia bacterium]